MFKHVLFLCIICCSALVVKGLEKTDGDSITRKNNSGNLKEQRLQYREALKFVSRQGNPFDAEGEIRFYDSLGASVYNSPDRLILIQTAKANSFLKKGDEKSAVDILTGLMGKVNELNNVAITARVQNMLALAYLRLGERNNCIASHGEGSCIFPIQGKGVYNDPSATQKAIKIYQQLLAQNPGDLESRWLLNMAYMTIGLYPGKVPEAYLIPGLDKDTSAYKIKPFVDFASSLKLAGKKDMCGGAITEDFNKDGYLDIVTSDWSLEESMHYYKNNGDGTFTDESKASGLSAIKGGLNTMQTDYNNDGYPDILVLRGAWLGQFGNQPSTLLRNNGNGTFTDVTVESGLLFFHPTQTAVWADFNKDGWLDLFVGAETTPGAEPHPSELFINNQDGTFTNVAEQAGVSEVAFMKAVASADYNNDGWPDLFISTQNGNKILLKNKGLEAKIPEFTNTTHEAGLDKDDEPTFPTWFFDYDNDGWPDIFICGYPHISFAKASAEDALHLPVEGTSNMQLFRNNHDGTFSNVSKEMGLDRPVFAMGSNYGDIDNDGWLDMYLGTGDPVYKSLIPNRMFKNIDGKKFAEVTTSARVGNLQKGHGVAFADMDNDGDQDIFMEVGGAYKGDAFYNSFYVNPGQNKNNWISIELEGVKSNRMGIGARIEVTFTEGGVKRTVYRDVNSGGSFGASPLRKEIGIGTATSIDQILIKWPVRGKNIQIIKDIKPDQFIKIKEGNEVIQKTDLKILKFIYQNDHMKMDMNHMMMTPCS